MNYVAERLVQLRGGLDRIKITKVETIPLHVPFRVQIQFLMTNGRKVLICSVSVNSLEDYFEDISANLGAAKIFKAHLRRNRKSNKLEICFVSGPRIETMQICHSDLRIQFFQ